MKEILWKPSSPEKSKMADLANTINDRYNQNLNDYEKLHQWSIENIPQFWEEIWN